MTDKTNCIKQLIVFALIICMTAVPATADKLCIGIAWVGKSGMADRVGRGLMEILALKAPGIDIELKKALPDLATLDVTAKRFQKEKSAMILLRSSGAKYLGEHPKSIPAFIGACNDPTQLGAVKNLQAPQGNVTGVTYALCHGEQLQKFRSILPKLESLLLLYEKTHPGSLIDREGTRRASNRLGLRYIERGSDTLDGFINIIKEMKGDVDAFIIGNQALLIDNALEIVSAAGLTPVFAYTKRPVYDGALGGVSADDVKLGRMLGESVIDVLIHRKAIRDIPIKTDHNPRLYVNIDTAERLGLNISYEFLDTVEIVR